MSRRVLAWVFAASALSAVAGAGATVLSAPARRVAAAGVALAAQRPDGVLAALGPPRVDDPAVVRYLRGTALIRMGRSADAAPELTAAMAFTDDPDLMWRTLHNLALARLDMASRTTGPEQALDARASVAAARDALRLRPSAPGTSWNLALALRFLPPEDGRGRRGDNGGLEVGAQRAGMSSQAPSARAPGGAMSPEEARAILDALSSGEAPSMIEDAVGRLRGSWGSRPSEGPPW